MWDVPQLMKVTKSFMETSKLFVEMDTHRHADTKGSLSLLNKVIMVYCGLALISSDHKSEKN